MRLVCTVRIELKFTLNRPQVIDKAEYLFKISIQDQKICGRMLLRYSAEKIVNFSHIYVNPRGFSQSSVRVMKSPGRIKEARRAISLIRKYIRQSLI